MTLPKVFKIIDDSGEDSGCDFLGTIVRRHIVSPWPALCPASMGVSGSGFGSRQLIKSFVQIRITRGLVPLARI